MKKLSLFLLTFVVPVGVLANGQGQDTTRELPEGIRLLYALKAPAGVPGRAVVFADKGRQLVTTTLGGIQAWDLVSGKLQKTWAGTFHALTISRDGGVLAAMDENKEIHLFDVATRQKQWQFRFTGVKPKEGAWANDTAVLAFSPDGKRMAVGCFQDIEIWDIARRKFSHRFQRETGYRFGIVDFFPDNNRLVVAGFPTYLAHKWDATLQKWDGLLLLYKYVRSAKLSPDGKSFVAGIDFGGAYGNLYCFSTDSRNGERRLRVPAPVNSIALSSDGRVVAARCTNGKLLLMHFKSFQIVDALNVRKAGEESFPLGLGFSPDGRLLAVDNGGEILVWDLKEWHKKLAQFERLSPERLEAVWQDLARYVDDGFFQVPPVYQLLGVPEQAVPLLAEKLKPVPPPDREKVSRLIGELDHREFAVRDKATKALHALDWLVKPALNEALRKASTLEMKRRIESLVKNMSSEWSGEHQRQYRAVYILTKINTEPARKILRELATGTPAAYLTQVAQEELKRINDRKAEQKK